MFKIVRRAMSVRYDFITDLTEEEAVEICNHYNWEWADENTFVWDLEIEEM